MVQAKPHSFPFLLEAKPRDPDEHVCLDNYEGLLKFNDLNPLTCLILTEVGLDKVKLSTLPFETLNMVDLRRVDGI